MQGESFGSGFLSGVLGSIGGGASLKYLGGSMGASTFTGFVMGGVGSVLSKGNFWVGAITGMGVSVFNHWGHKYQAKKLLRDEFKGTGMNPDDKATFSDHEILTEKLPTLKNIKDRIVYEVIEDNSIGGKGLVLETDPTKIRVNLNKAKNLLDYAYTLGHEMIHVFDNMYNSSLMLNIFGRNKTGRELRAILMEYRAYQ